MAKNQRTQTVAVGVETSTALIEIPIMPDREGMYDGFYMQTRVEVGRLSELEARTLRRVREGCQRSGARLANGREVVSNPDAVRYLLQLASEAP